MKKIISALLILLSFYGFATHNRAGEILYKRIAPFTAIIGGEPVQVYNYLFTINKYTNDGDDVADACEDTLYFGDGTKQLIKRINGGATACPTCQPCNCDNGAPCGVLIINDNGYRVKVNTYTVTHTYAGSGRFLIKCKNAYRDENVHNMDHSGSVFFYLESLLIINSFTGANSSPEFAFLPTDKACLNQCFYHNPGAFDADGDSLSYEITTSRGENGLSAPGYFTPDMEGGTYGINAITGTMYWCGPKNIAEYNLAFIVKEWRKNTDKKYEMVGYILRDMQVIVLACNNTPPNLIVPMDTCVEAGTFINKKIIVTDANPSSTVTLSGGGGAFSATAPNAILSNTFANTTYTADFSWQTTCDHIRLLPYASTFKAQDEGIPVKLTYFATYNIRVVPPSVKNVLATPIGSTIKITWASSLCNPISNPIVNYKIYRKNDCTPFVHDPCTSGVSTSSGYTFIGLTPASGTTFIDNNNGNGLVVGQDYSYLVIAVYNDGSQSYASSQICAKLKRDVPILLNVDILSTSALSGSVYVRWSRPLKGPGGIDTLVFPGPYSFTLKHRAGSTGTFSPVFITTKPYIYQLDTDYFHVNVNTINTNHEYVVEFAAGSTTIGTSQKATSVFLNAISGDRKIDLQWAATTPWNNYTYTVYRKDPGSISFYSVAVTGNTQFTDSNHVVNRYNYCYKILSEGKYSDPSVYKPLLNRSQEVCTTAKDNSIPCTPTIVINANCPAGFIKVEWNNVALTCSDDVIKYVLYRKETVDADYVKLDTLYGANSTVYSFDGLNLISSCFAIQAVDSSGNASALSGDYCVDNCPEFDLPNIITLNGDGVNDFFKAIRVRQIKEIDLYLYDRWGNLVFKTNDPAFKWDGTSLLTKQIVSAGTFFYICDVFEPGVRGVKKRNLKGYLQIVH